LGFKETTLPYVDNLQELAQRFDRVNKVEAPITNTLSDSAYFEVESDIKLFLTHCQLKIINFQKNKLVDFWIYTIMLWICEVQIHGVF